MSIFLLGFPSLIHVEKEEMTPKAQIPFMQEILSPTKQMENNTASTKLESPNFRRELLQSLFTFYFSEPGLQNRDSNGNPIKSLVYREAVYHAFPPEGAFG